MFANRPLSLVFAVALGAAHAPHTSAQDRKPTTWPMFGGTPARNMVNPIDKNTPIHWSTEPGKFKNIKWAVKLGSRGYAGPVIADGRVYVGTNKKYPHDPKVASKAKATLVCLDEADGRFLWQNVHDSPDSELISYIDRLGLLSTPAIDAGRIYYVTPGCEVICADAATGKILWQYDMMTKLGVKLGDHISCAFSSTCSPLVAGGKVFITTGNGVAEGSGKVKAPKAPSFVAFDKAKGTVAWQSSLPGENIVAVQWSNPVLASVSGKQQVIFAGGDNFVYSFDPDTGKLIWKCNLDPERPAAMNVGKRGTRPERGVELRPVPSYPIGTPVVHDNKLYIGLGHFPDEQQPRAKFSRFLCLDVTKKGDASPVNLDAKDPKNKASALVWTFGGPLAQGQRRVKFGSTISTAAVHDGLVWIAEENGYLHCLDAKTGQRYWEYDVKSQVHAAPYWVDGKVYLTASDQIHVLAHGKEMKRLGMIDADECIRGSVPLIAAKGVLYLSCDTHMYAISAGGMAHEAK
jgi:outer membrane protein assembly factor BamB